MSMNRRSVLLGLGTAAAGSGAVFGSGAFTQTSADRDVDLAFANDSGAALALAEGENSDSGSGDPEALVQQDGSGGASKLEISLGDDSGMVTDGVNLFRDVIKVTNNGDDNVFLNTQVNSSNQSRAARVRVLVPVSGQTGGTDSVASANTSEDDTIAAKIDSSTGLLTSSDDAIDISQPSDFDSSSGPGFADNFRLALLNGTYDFYETGIVEIPSGENVNLSLEVEAGPNTGAGGTESNSKFNFSGEYRFVARNANDFDGGSIESTASNFFNTDNNLDGF